LGVLCKDCTVEHLNRIADILTQLLQTDDQQEFSQVQTSLLTVFKQNPKCKRLIKLLFYMLLIFLRYFDLNFFLKATLNEIFNQINTAELEEVRKRAIKFLVAKLPGLFDSTGTAPPASPFNKELEDIIVKNVKQVTKLHQSDLKKIYNLRLKCLNFYNIS